MMNRRLEAGSTLTCIGLMSSVCLIVYSDSVTNRMKANIYLSGKRNPNIMAENFKNLNIIYFCVSCTSISLLLTIIAVICSKFR